MSGNRTIQETLKNIVNAHTNDTIFFIDAVVNSVDQDNRLCECQAVGGQSANVFSNCRLMASVDDGFLIIPTVDSAVVLLLSSFTDPVVVSYSEVDKIIMRGGDLGGLPRIEDLVTKYNNLENFCNNLQTKLNDLISKYNSHFHTGVQTGGGVSGTTAATETPDTDTPLTETIRDDIENTAITQG